jgi:hypothetical protein
MLNVYIMGLRNHGKIKVNLENHGKISIIKMKNIGERQ